jgi:4-methyl-5(b-hydroxyethyl)-thiazole monophosphate biosynthesis
MNKNVLVILAEGFEEIEAVTPIDVLRRAELNVTVAGVGSKTIRGAHGVRFQADTTLNQYKDLPDAVILPGGMPGAQNLANSKEVREILTKMNSQNKLIGAICAAPALVLAPSGILEGKKATCYPGFENHFNSSTQFSPARVVVDGHIITSRGPGSALEFALELVEKLAGKEKAESLSQGLLAKA